LNPSSLNSRFATSSMPNECQRSSFECSGLRFERPLGSVP
jgi:hypothetical protein